MTNKSVFSFYQSERLVENLVLDVKNTLLDAIRKYSKATLLLSGGNTPKKFLQALSKEFLPWNKIDISLVDERWVDENDEASNANLVRTHLLQNRAKEANFVSLYREEKSSLEAEMIVNNELSKLFERVDVLLLGMGDDGHIASLFKESERFKEALDYNNHHMYIAMQSPKEPQERLSLSLRKILDAKQLFLHFEGKKKIELYTQALKDKQKYSMAIEYLLHQEHNDSLKVYFT